MTTQELILKIKQTIPVGTITGNLMEQAATRLEQLFSELEMVKKDRSRYAKEISDLKGYNEPYRPDWVRKDPSRLELAAMFYATEWCDDAQTALRFADELIAANREVK